ncbi:hypothetical protein [Raoultella ornithinolytica]|uniref:hypothetical protein n=1 Tax=Raoultella ornithinolytica TaxID=54291 RepID=UPI001F47D33D|nr:hypothetical protein [Raoultella ornithinolytica]MCF6684928.1 hypothetical protein [Raoultella ornithinolytica]HBX7662614.1 hypothetical protein [Klebsiella pneumoniae]HDT6531161.1 hypothetical protein [Raoultella ornithinolytica]
MPAISEIKSQGNMKFPFSNTLEGRAAGGSPIPAAFLKEHPKQQIILTAEITSQQCISKRIFHGVT